MNSFSKLHTINNNSLNNLHHMQLHTTICQLISASINLRRLGIPDELFFKYQQQVVCELRFIRLSLVSTITAHISDDEWLTLRLQADGYFNQISTCIQSTFDTCTDIEEEKTIEDLIWQINKVIKMSFAKSCRIE